MNLKKFISGVSAVAIAASAFAAMAVTASATDYTDVVVETAGIERADKITDETTGEWGGLWKTAGNSGNKYSLALADLSGLTDIDKASSVTVDFDTMIQSGGGSRLVFGLGDKAVRGTTAGTSSRSTYNRDGIAMFLGTSNGTAYYINGTGTNLASAFGHTVHVHVTLDRTESKYSYVVTDMKTGGELKGTDITTTVSNITVIEAYSWQNNMTYGLTDVTVSYTVPETPTHNYTINAVDGNGNVLSTIATGLTAEGYGYGADVNEVVEANGKYYQLDSSVTGYHVEYTMGNADATQGVLYNENSAIVGYQNAGHANGASHSSQYANLGTLPAGNYKVTTYFKERGDRGLVVRNKAIDATADNVIYRFPFDKNTTAGVYEGEFTLTEATNVGLSGRDTDSATATNQSGEFYYVIVEFVSEYVPETTEAGFTFGSMIEDFNGKAVELTITATNGEEFRTSSIDITDKFEGFSGDLMLAVIINDVPAGITITSATIEVE